MINSWINFYFKLEALKEKSVRVACRSDLRLLD